MPMYVYEYLNAQLKVRGGELGARTIQDASNLLARRIGRSREYVIWEKNRGQRPARPLGEDIYGKR